MGKALIIAEKPSVAGDIAKALGGFQKDKSGEFFESPTHVISSAVGHLLELGVPEEHDIKKGKWTFTHLPHIPPRFALNPIEKSEARLKVLQRLIKRKDVDALINACDAGREGELIFRLIEQCAGGKKPIDKPVKRLWLQSMTPQAIRDGFDNLRSEQQMQGLADAARSRSEADWLVGINGTRAMTAFNSRDGGFFLTTVGRVQTPTLSIVVEREEKIRKHVARDYWELRADFDAFCASRADWLDDYALFMALKDAHPGLTWNRWPAPLVRRDPQALAAFRGTHPEVMREWLAHEAETHFAVDPQHRLTRRERKHRWSMKLERLTGWDLSKNHFRLVA